VKKESTRPITKWMLYKNAIRTIVIVGICFGVGLMILLHIVTLFNSDSLSWQESIFEGLGAGMFLCLFLVALCSINPLNGVIRLSKQEKALSLSFSDEMNNNNITSTNYENYQWFIRTEGVTVLAFHRDYIHEIEKIDDPNGRGVRLIAAVRTFNGKKIKIASLYDNISEFEQWFLQLDKE